MNAILAVEALIAFLIALTIHEVAQALVSSWLGDKSAARQGRLSLWPPRHMSAIGTLVAVVLVFSGFPNTLGWGKPIEPDTRNLRVNPDLGLVLVAVSGIVINTLVGVALALGLHFFPGYDKLDSFANRCGGAGSILQNCLSQAQPVYMLRIEQFLITLAVTNILFAMLNIIPLYPLDGYHILFAWLPNRAAVRYRDFQPYMEFTLLIVFFLIPYLLRIIGLSQFEPTALLEVAANTIGLSIAGGAYGFYLLI
ncbi:MAG TPA: site-2 protease family protein [Ktedonobacterales bacterium]|nr:site-2 protease family protein [Ktedonobacterales bacterium]